LNNKNGNGHKGFWNPVKVFIRTLFKLWEKEDKISGENYLVDSEIVKADIEDVADEPHNESGNGKN
jgi:hypothetical protein